MSLFDRLRGNQQPVQLSAPPGDSNIRASALPTGAPA